MGTKSFQNQSREPQNDNNYPSFHCYLGLNGAIVHLYLRFVHQTNCCFISTRKKGPVRELLKISVTFQSGRIVDESV